MTRLQELLSEYSESHQNPVNKAVHWVCVPAIFWSIVGLLYAVPLPGESDWMNLALLALAAVMVYYVRLSVPISIVMFVFAMTCFLTWRFIDELGLNVPLIAIIVFVVAWIGQFWGHKVEGKKPSFLKDLQFLLIGPAWLASQVMKMEGARGE